MGNCQAAEAATVVIQHPGGKIERVYWSINAGRVMADNPGHYVAVIIAAPSSGNKNVTDGKNNGRRRNSGSNGDHAAPVKHLKLLRPDDTLLIGHVYRLVSFEEVVRKFETKRHAKLSKLVVNTSSTHGRREARKEGGEVVNTESEKNQALTEVVRDNSEEEEEADEVVSMAQALIRAGTIGRSSGSRAGQWKPALQSISEVAGT